MVKVYELLKKRLETDLIEHSESPWASPIVIILKKNGIDIRMCIDYRVVNNVSQLFSYPLSLIDDLLIGFEGAMWFMSLDMASGFWAIRMTERAKLVSAFVRPFGHVQWVQEALVDRDVLEYLGLDSLVPDMIDDNRDGTDKENSKHSLPVLTEQMTVIPAPPQMGPGLGRLLPEGTVLDARGYILSGVTVNDEEYYGLLKGLNLALEHDVQDLVVVGDSRIVIQQVQGLFNCNQLNLQRKLTECQVIKDRFNTVRLVHVKREFKQAADYLTSKTLALGDNWTLTGTPKEEPESSSVPGPESAPLTPAARVMAVLTRPRARNTSAERPPMGSLEFQAERWRRIRGHQEENEYVSEVKTFLNGEVGSFSPRRLRKIAKVVDLFALDARGILYRRARSSRDRPRDVEDELRLVVPRTLRDDMLNYAHEDFQGGHQGITLTHERLRLECYWHTSQVRTDPELQLMIVRDDNLISVVINGAVKQ
ncbi:unnamed protein product [Phytophthora fragariaefolia]|uniref:Unnamed protein product n=1 Tax=Phytophthora fragariaefolia TaxID=1490495 RepID=A0A9W7D8E1_9STRA|nr:unnamed protein product [Phytophthora fragariaefolia]